MTQPVRAKYCPRCSCIAYADAAVCGHCGHTYHTGVAAPAEEADSPEKTRMFVFAPQVRSTDGRGSADLARSGPVPWDRRLRRALAVVSRIGVIPFLVGLLLLGLAAWVWKAFL